MSKEAIEQLEDYCKWCNAQGGQCQLSLDGCAAGEALEILKEQPPASGLTMACREYLRIGQLEDDMNCYYIANLCD